MSGLDLQKAKRIKIQNQRKNEQIKWITKIMNVKNKGFSKKEKNKWMMLLHQKREDK